MFMRFLQLKLKPDAVDSFVKFYNSDVVDELHNSPGCLFAGLIKSKPEENELISLTFWQTQKNAEEYETTGAFQNLFEQSKKYLSETAEWKLQLSENMELEYSPVEEEPTIKKYTVAIQNNETNNFDLSSDKMYVRIFSIVIQEDKLEEFTKLYTDIIIPALKNTKGCKYVFLTKSVNQKNEFISVTIWENKDYADKYESSGKFDELTEKIKHTFSQFYLWKMSLEKEYGSRIKTSEDFKLEKYNIVTGKSFL